MGKSKGAGTSLQIVFSPVIEILKLGKTLTFKKYISEKKGLHLFLEQKIEKHHSRNIDLQKITGPQPFFETEML